MLVASLFVTSFEMLKTTVQGKIRDFLCINAALNDQGEFEYEISDQYRYEILGRKIPHIDKRKTRDYHLFYSSCLWLKENSVITKEDINYLEQIRKHRNLIAHEPLRLLIDENANININLLKKSQQLLNKIERWWILEFEIQVNPDFDGKKINEGDVQSGMTIFLDYLMLVANAEINSNNE